MTPQELKDILERHESAISGSLWRDLPLCIRYPQYDWLEAGHNLLFFDIRILADAELEHDKQRV